MEDRFGTNLSQYAIIPGKCRPKILADGRDKFFYGLDFPLISKFLDCKNSNTKMKVSTENCHFLLFKDKLASVKIRSTSSVPCRVAARIFQQLKCHLENSQAPAQSINNKCLLVVPQAFESDKCGYPHEDPHFYS